MNQRITSLVALAVVVGSLFGCKRIAQIRRAAQSVQEARESTGETPQSNDDGDDNDAALGNKLGEYINCLNSATKDVFNSRKRYLSWANDKTGPTGKERTVYGLYQLNNTEYCTKAIDKAKDMKPTLADIETIAEQYKAALAQLIPQVKKVHDYYDQKNYKDDGWANGKTMHGPLMAAFAQFDQANKPFEDKVTSMNDALQLRNLAKLEKDPKRRLEYLTARGLQDAKKLVNAADVTDLDSLNADAYNATLEAYEKSFTDLDQYMDQHKAETDKITMFGSFVSDSKNYLKAAKELMRRKREKKDFNKETFSNNHPEMVEGHPAQIIDKYNRMIQASNRLRF